MLAKESRRLSRRPAGMVRSTQRDWAFFRQVAREMLWPKIDP